MSDISEKTVWDILFDKGWTIKDAPGKILQKSFPDHRGTAKWEIIINGNKEPVTVKPEQWGEMSLGPFTMAVFWNGWLAGLITPVAGTIAAHPDGANEDNLLKSLEIA